VSWAQTFQTFLQIEVLRELGSVFGIYFVNATEVDAIP
jgi:hypothetical protein